MVHFIAGVNYESECTDGFRDSSGNELVNWTAEIVKGVRKNYTDRLITHENKFVPDFFFASSALFCRESLFDCEDFECMALVPAIVRHKNGQEKKYRMIQFLQEVDAVDPSQSDVKVRSGNGITRYIATKTNPKIAIYKSAVPNFNMWRDRHFGLYHFFMSESMVRKLSCKPKIGVRVLECSVSG